ncbi:MAG TPA: CDP-glycerol glycerophosphotransferase family protein [Arcobacter sp.]|nr:CDP-glycerol glycerophosphotransferase family protein [Arcobacter sp.]
MNIIIKIIRKILNIKIDKNGTIIIKKNIPFIHRIFLQNSENKIFFTKTKKSHALNIFTVKDALGYDIFAEIKFSSFTFKLQLPVKVEKLLSANGKYISYSKEPVKKGLVVFESFFGKSYSGQPKYIYEYLLALNLPYQYVWVYQDNTNNIPGNPTIVKRGSLEYFKYAAKAEYLVNNIVFPFHSKRDETIYLQTWHGTPLKKLGFDITVAGPEANARENFHKESRNWDYLVTQNSFTTEVLKRAFKFEKSIIESGYPHNDILIQNSKKRATEIKISLNIPKDKKVILYAPTWRDNDANANWSFNFSLKINLLKWQKILGNEYVILIRMHHLITKIKGLEEAEGFAYNVSKYDDIQELSLISDILITDYSSVFFDFAVTKKPILFFAYDIKEYAENMRGFYLDIHNDLPGPIIKTNTELLESIQNIDTIKKEYRKKYEIFNQRFCYLDNGECSKKVAEKVFKEINE